METETPRRKRGRPPKAKLEIVKAGPLDFPRRDLPIPGADGKPSGLTLPVQFVPWADTIPREELTQALIEDDSPGALEFLRSLADPLQMDLPISALAGKAGIRVPELMAIWRNHMKIAAMGVALSQAPLIARDTLEDAKSVIVCCSRCDGAGVIQVQKQAGPEWLECIACKGKGSQRKPGDPKSREWILRASEVIAADGPSVLIQNSNNITADSVLDDLDRLERNAVEVVALPDSDA